MRGRRTKTVHVVDPLFVTYEVKCSIQRARNADDNLCDHELYLILQ